MKHYRDAITVGKVKCMYSVLHRGWLMPSGEVVRNPLKAQRLAEELDKKRGAHDRLWRIENPKNERGLLQTPIEIFNALDREFGFWLMLQPLRVMRYALTISLELMTC